MLVHRFDLKDNKKDYTWHCVLKNDSDVGLEIMESINSTEVWNGTKDELVNESIERINKANKGETIIIKDNGITLKITKIEMTMSQWDALADPDDWLYEGYEIN